MLGALKPLDDLGPVRPIVGLGPLGSLGGLGSRERRAASDQRGMALLQTNNLTLVGITHGERPGGPHALRGAAGAPSAGVKEMRVSVTPPRVGTRETMSLKSHRDEGQRRPCLHCPAVRTMVTTMATNPGRGHDPGPWPWTLGCAPQPAVPTTFLWVRSPSWHAIGAATGSANPARGAFGVVSTGALLRDGA